MIYLLGAGTLTISDDLLGVIITACVTSIISIIGFIITNTSMKKSFKNELMKQRDGIALEKMATIPYDVLSLMDRIIKKSKENQADEIENFNMIMKEIYSYGSQHAISILALMQKENYELSSNSETKNSYRVMALYVLLATQIKYDVTGIYVNPEFWYRMKITDYEKNKSLIKIENNKLIEELRLSNKLKIK